MTTPAKLNCAVCRECGEILHSKHRHDFVICGCPNQSFVDGGSDYTRSGGVDLTKIKFVLTMAEARRLSAGIKEKCRIALAAKTGLPAPIHDSTADNDAMVKAVAKLIDMTSDAYPEARKIVAAIRAGEVPGITIVKANNG